jgi:NADP-dependent 3-hydroxy acid dehydrogenase YdfG
MTASPVVLVTGAVTGIGRASALAFAREGARLVISGRRPEEGKQLAEALRGFGAEAEFVQADVRFDNEMRALVDFTVGRFESVDIAVNAAGTEGDPGPLVEATPERYSAIFDVNVLGTLLAMRHELRAMLTQGRGSIVNVSSLDVRLMLRTDDDVYLANGVSRRTSRPGRRDGSAQSWRARRPGRVLLSDRGDIRSTRRAICVAERDCRGRHRAPIPGPPGV